MQEAPSRRGSSPARRAAAGVVLAGGRSSRMGTPKAWLDWDGEPLLARVVGTLHAAVDGPVVVVRAAGQRLPQLPAGTEIVDDEVPDRGPLPAIGRGLGVVGRRRDAAFVAAVDLPLLRPAFVGCVLDALRPEGPSAGHGTGHDVALPIAHGHRQPLAAAYRTSLSGLIDRLVARGEGRPPALFAACRVRGLDADALLADPDVRRDDPALASLTNVNTPEEYAAARGDERHGG